MLDQLFNIVKQFGQDTVVNNPDVPEEYNQDVMADATKTIASGFQNIMAGGGFQNILDLFKGGGTSAAGKTGGLGGLLKNPIVTMMVGYFISKLVSKYKMSPSSASNVANSLIPNALNSLIQQTNDPSNESATIDNLVGELVGRAGVEADQNESREGFSLQNLLEQFSGAGNGGSGSAGGINIQDIIGSLTQKAQNRFGEQEGSGGGLMDLIRGFVK